MKTFRLSRNGKEYDVDAADEAEANTLLDEHLAIDVAPSKMSTFRLSRNGKEYDVDAADEAEANTLLDEDLALQTIKSTRESDEREALIQGVSDQAMGAARGIAPGAITAAAPLVGLGVEGSKAITDALALGMQELEKRGMWPKGWAAMTTDQAIDFMLKSANLPTGDETSAGRALQTVGSALSGVKSVQALDKLVNTGLVPQTTTQRVVAELADKPISQAVGAATGAATASAASSAGVDPFLSGGIGILTGLLAQRGYQNWGQVKKAIDAGEIKDADRAYLLRMAQEYPVLTQSAFPLKSNTGKAVQRLAENSPFIGTSGQVAREAAGRQQAMQDFVEGVGPQTMGEKLRLGVEDLTAGRGERIRTLTNRKRELLDAASTGKPIDAEMEVGMGGAPLEARRAMAQRWTPAEATIVETPDVAESLKAINAIQRTLAEAKNPTAFGPYIEKLNALGDALKKANPRGIELNRKVLSDMRKDAALGSIAKTIDPYTRDLYSATASSLSKTIRKTLGEEAGQEWDSINKQLSESADDLKTVPLKTAINKGSPNVDKVLSVVEYAEKNSDPKLVANMVKDMTPQGKSDMADAIALNWFQKAGLGANRSVDDIDLDKAYAELRNSYGPSGLFFTKDKLDRARMLTEYLKTAEPERGIPNYPHFGTNLWDWAAFIPASAFMRIYNSKPVMNALIKMKDLNKKSPEYRNLVRQLSNTIQGEIQSGGLVEEIERRKAEQGEIVQ